MLQTVGLIVAALTGAALHQALFIHGEWHLYVPEILLAHALAFSIACFFLAWTHSSYLFGAYLIGLYSSIALYRLFFHRTRNFPGPRLAGLTKLWHVFKSRNSTNFLVLQKLHEQYGELVRTGPNEITIFRPDAAELLDGYKNTNTRDVWYDILHPRKALVFARGKEEMRDLRGSWSQAVSSKCVNEYTPRILRLADTLVDCIRSHGPGVPVLLNDVMSWFAFDAMGEITFGEDFGMLENQSSIKDLMHQRQALALLAPLNDATWIAHMGFRLTPWLGAVRGWWAAVEFCETRMKRRMKSKTSKTDMSQFFINEHDNANGSASYRNSVLMGNSISAIVAGSDTTRAALIAIWYYLIKHPSHISILRAELSSINIDRDVNKLAALPHLNAVIKETLRLAPPAMSGSSRITGEEGLWVGDVWIPGKTKVTSPKYVVQRLPEAFVEPNAFIPERWTSKPELVLDQRAYSPFSVGPHQCIGKAISHLELRVVTAKLLQAFDAKFSTEPEQGPELFWTEMKDQVTMMPGKLWCVFSDRAMS